MQLAHLLCRSATNCFHEGRLPAVNNTHPSSDGDLTSRTLSGGLQPNSKDQRLDVNVRVKVKIRHQLVGGSADLSSNVFPSENSGLVSLAVNLFVPERSENLRGPMENNAVM